MTEQSVYHHLREFREAFDKPEPLAWPEISHGRLLVLMLETDMEDAALGILRDYPAMAVPHHLIVGPRDGSAVHHWAPARRAGTATYGNRQHYTFTETITVGGWKIDTTVLPRYSQDAGR
ncbi:hypothetical protein [Streptomyces fagopyri]|uniref:hypothetical protein n=1 Tax=Streptomyces fagopyri TaxID=2662397 RepID=UPI0033EEA50E